MTIYYLGEREIYIDKIAEFIVANYHSKLSDLKVIVPNTLACFELQKALLKKIGVATLLPNIMPINFIAQESDISYNIPTEFIDVAGTLEQKLLLMDIIQKHHPTKFSLIQIGHLSDQLIKLFMEITSLDFDINSLHGIVDLDSASHWQITTNFITNAYDLWKNAIRESGKIDPLTHQKIVLNLESGSNEARTTIVAGITYGSKASNDFIKRMAQSRQHVVILPPFDIASGKWDSEIEPYYRVKKLIDYCECDVAPLPLESESVMDESICNPCNCSNIEFVTATNLFEEAEIISLIAMNASHNEKVGIVAQSKDLVNLCEISLNKYGKELQNLNGKSLISTKHAEFLLLVASCAVSGEIENIISLLKTPFMLSEALWKFEMKMLRRPAVKNIKDLIDVVNEDGSNEEVKFIIDFWNKISAFHSKATSSEMVVLSELIAEHIKAINLLVPNFRSSIEGAAIFNFLDELIKYARIIDFINPDHYPDLVRHLVSRAKYFPKVESNIMALSAADAALLKLDRVIIADCNEGSFPQTNLQDPWMSNKMRIAAGLSSLEDAIGQQHYYFSLLIKKPRVFITRTKTQEKTESRFLMEFLKENSNGKVLTSYDWSKAVKLLRQDATEIDETVATGIADSSLFPHSISATNIELLVRNPYGFYAKKILGLSELDEINREITLADFGTLLHNIVAVYTESYISSEIDKLGQMLEIGKVTFESFHDHNKTRAWWRKFTEIAAKFIEWDEERRKSLSHVYSEIYGEMFLDIDGKKLKVTAIADRIEVAKDGSLNILDYKTGVVPTKQDVLRGLSPQLLVEAMIARVGGFKNIGKANVSRYNLIYVKLGNIVDLSSKELSIDISEEDLQQHQIAMENLFRSYISAGVFSVNSIEKHRPKYDVYKHLARL